MVIILLLFRVLSIVFEWVQEVVNLVILIPARIYLPIQEQTVLLVPAVKRLAVVAAAQVDTVVMAVPVEHVLAAHLKPVAPAEHMVVLRRVVVVTAAPVAQVQPLT
jgi:hypothetical protein